MAFDSTKPANGSPIVSAELRNQFNSLNDDLQQRALSIDVQDAINVQSSGPVNDVNALALTVSNPPTQAQVQAIANKIDEMLTALKRM